MQNNSVTMRRVAIRTRRPQPDGGIRLPLLYLLGAIAAVFAPTSVFGFASTDEEFAKLPRYCMFRQRDELKQTPEFKKWVHVIGPANFNHMHHYCSGLNHVQKAMGMNKSHPEYKRQLQQAVGAYEYVQEKAEPGFFLRPEINVQKGKALVMLGRTAEAVGEFEQAIQTKADYAPAYGALSDLQVKQGDRAAARATLQRGLTANPTSPSLQRRLRVLNGGLAASP